MEQQLSDARDQELQPTAAQATTSADFSYEVIHNLIYILCPINKNDDGNADLDMDLPPDADESAAQATISHEEEEIDVSFLFLWHQIIHQWMVGITQYTIPSASGWQGTALLHIYQINYLLYIFHLRCSMKMIM